MTWQCQKCLVTFRQDQPVRSHDTPAVCEVPGCRIAYHDRLHGGPGNGFAAMYLAKETAMEEYRRKYEKDFSK